MIFGLLILVVALTLSTVAAFYSITGLTAIFPGAVIPIIVMGASLEVSKIVSTVWLHKYWNRVAVQFKLYLIPAIVILMLITSMGIFGLLSKAHLDQAIPSGDVSAKLSLIDEKIRTEKENVNASRKELSQLDAQVDQTLSRTTEASGADRAISIRRGQQKDRNRILNEIGQAQTKISKLNEERAPIASEVRKVEAEVGPIKYIAALIYGDKPDDDILEKAVRWVIILIVSVFDPLALVLILAADQTFEWAREKINKTEIIEPIQVNVNDEVPVWEEMRVSIKPEEHPVEKIITDYAPAEVTDEELNITVDESKDWEPNLYNRLEKRDESLPQKTQSFLNKAKEVFSSIGVKSIEKEVEDLQEKKPK